MLGNVGTYSGPVGNSVGAVREAIQAWASYVNDHGGVGPDHRPVKVITASDDNKPETTLKKVKEMVETYHVDALISMYSVQNTSAVVSYLEKQHVPVIGGDLIDPAWVNSSAFFPQGSSFAAITGALAHMAVKGGTKKIGIFYCIDTDLCSIGTKYVEAAAAKYGAQVVYKAAISLAQPAFTAECFNAKKAGVDFLLIGADPPTFHRVGSDCAKQNFHPRYASPSVAATAALEHEPEMEGLVSGQPYFPWMAKGTPAVDAFHAAMAQYAPGVTLSSGTAGAWTSGQLFLAAASKVQGGITGDSLISALYTLRNETLGGLTVPLTFSKGAPHPQPMLYFPVQIVKQVFVAPQGVTPAKL